MTKLISEIVQAWPSCLPFQYPGGDFAPMGEDRRVSGATTATVSVLLQFRLFAVYHS
jgi:hypothetical protein